jgi:hypothetical protein
LQPSTERILNYSPGPAGIGGINCSPEAYIKPSSVTSIALRFVRCYAVLALILFNDILGPMSSASVASSQHQAAILPSKGHALEIGLRPTPTPGPDDLLIEVKSIALNPIDHYMRDMGFVIASYPAIVGSDIAGVVLSAGSAVPSQ